MSDPTPQPDPSEVLTDAERLNIQRATECVTAHRAARGVNDLSSVRNPIEQLVARIIAARTADTAARLAAVEAVMADGPETWEGYDSRDAGHVFAADLVLEFVTDLRAALSAAVDNADQCEAKKNLVVRFQAAVHAHLVPHPELGTEEDDRGCLPCLMIAQAVIPVLFVGNK